MPQFLAPLINDQQIDANGDPLNAGEIEIYLAGSSTAAASYSDKAGLIPNEWPIVLNTLGLNSQGAVWLPGGTAYKFVVKNEFGLVQRTIDNVTGINDTSITVDQWILFPGPPTYISATSFSVGGDQTPTLQVGRRLKSINTGGTVYSTIVSSVYGAPNTTVTVQNDSGALDAGLSQVSYGVVSALDSSLPSGRLLGLRKFETVGTFIYNETPGTRFIVLEEVGGGGAGGGTPSAGAGAAVAAGGGAAGNYGKKLVTSGFSGAAVVVGAAGVGVASANGGAGGTTSFGGTVLVCPGGGGGAVGSPSSSVTYGSSPGTSGTTTGADFSVNSSPATPAIQMGSSAISGSGGSCPLGSGTGGVAVAGTSASHGNPPSPLGRGGGGSGGACSGAAAVTRGGDGQPGAVYIWEYA